MHSSKHRSKRLTNVLHGVFAFAVALGVTPGLAAESAPRRIRFDHLTNADGLTQNSILAMTQDRLGFMWFGTFDGLNRYDGHRFKHFRYRPGESSSLASGRIRALAEDRAGHLWIGTDSGLDRLDPLHETITHYRHHPDDPASLAHDEVNALWVDATGALWVGTGGGLHRFDAAGGGAAGGGFARYRHDPQDPASLAHDTVLSIHGDRNGQLWIGTGGGLERFDAGRGGFVHHRHDAGDPASLSHDVVTAIHEDALGTLWIGTGGGLNRFDAAGGGAAGGGFVRYRHDPRDGASLGHDDVRAIHEDASGTLWIGTRGGGLDRFEAEAFLHYRHDSQNPGSLSDDDVISLYEDSFGGLWVGTDGGALNRFDPAQESFLHDRHHAGDPTSLSHDDVMALHEDRSGALWIGTDGGGLNRLEADRARRSFRHYRHDGRDPASLSHDSVFALWEDSVGGLWVGTRQGLNRLDPTRSWFKRYRHDPESPASLPHDDVRALLEDREGVLWIGTQGGGLSRFNPLNQSFVNYRHDPRDPASLSDDNVMVLLEDHAGTLWIGTRGGGLNRLAPARRAFERYPHDPDDPTSLSHGYVRALLEDHMGRLWVGTYGGGLNLLDRQRGTFVHLTQRSGLVNNVVYGILEDDLGRLWLSTNGGLARYEPVTGTWTDYDVRDGLQDNEFNSGAAWHGALNEMFFGGIHGFNSFFPERFTDDGRVPPLYLTSLRVFDREASLARAAPYVEEIELDHRQNFFSFEVAALDFRRSSRNRYRYRLEGFDSAWHHSESRPLASYTKVPPGRYVFRAQASSAGGLWNEEGLAVALVVSPPFWRTWWFHGLEILALAGLAAGVFRFQRRRLEHEQEDELHHQELLRKTEELDFARHVQLSMLPESNLEAEKVEIFGRMITATEIGGDYYDIFPPAKSRKAGKCCIVAGDAMGHGMAAGLVVGMLKAAIVHSLRKPGAKPKPERLVRSLNATLEEALPIRRLGMCLGVAMLDLADLTVELCSMGMPFPYHYRAAEDELVPLELEGLPLGLWRRLEAEPHRLQLAPGDALVMLSDGFPERRDQEDDVWGYEAVEKNLRTFCRTETSAEGIASRLIDACDLFAASREPEDDMTVVVVRAR